MLTNPLTRIPEQAPWKEGDTLLLVGELFGRGYANGIVEEARRRGMTIVGTTVGRRDADGTLRPLTDQELETAESLLGGTIVNVPIEAGFDMEASDDGRSPCDLLKGAKPDQWDQVTFPEGFLLSARQRGTARFRENLARVVDQLCRTIPGGSRILIVHAMAGGVPRARIFMPLLNRIFKGRGEKYLPSETFWNSDLGTLCRLNFDEVTADTFLHLVDLTQPLREGREVRYVAYGYHGTRIMIGEEYRWQSYTPYLQGWAKIRLESHAAEARARGVPATVYNAPEIQTNSSALFLGVELSLYPFIRALRFETPSVVPGVEEGCRLLLKDDVTVDDLLEAADRYHASLLLSPFQDPTRWPFHSTREEMELMLETSERLLDMGRDPKEPVCALLSRLVFTGVGRLMLDHCWSSSDPVVWLDHDMVARRLAP